MAPHQISGTLCWCICYKHLCAPPLWSVTWPSHCCQAALIRALELPCCCEVCDQNFPTFQALIWHCCHLRSMLASTLWGCTEYVVWLQHPARCKLPCDCTAGIGHVSHRILPLHVINGSLLCCRRCCLPCVVDVGPGLVAWPCRTPSLRYLTGLWKYQALHVGVRWLGRLLYSDVQLDVQRMWQPAHNKQQLR